jgi:signal transduction histidine kinase
VPIQSRVHPNQADARMMGVRNGSFLIAAPEANIFFMNAPLPENEVERLRALQLYQVLDTLPEDAFDEITQLAAHICGCPIATVSIIDEHRQWYKSRVGLDLVETPRDMAFCAHTILDNKPVIVEDMTLDARFADNPAVMGGPMVRFYAGMPLTNKDGFALGTLCVIDLKTRQLSNEQTLALEALSRHVVTHLELRRALIERSLAEAEVQSMNLTLENRVLERTTELNSVNQALKIANQAKTEFLTNMSHEIRTPLNAITGMTDLMLGTPLTEEQKDFLETIHANGENLLTIVNDVLDFSRIEFGKLELDPHDFNLPDLLGEIAAMFRFRAAEKNLVYTSLIDPDLPTNYRGDATRIKQVFVNLVSNAIKFTEQGEIRIDITGIKSYPGDDADKQRLLFCVMDTGIGIPLDRKDSLFRAFSQADASTTRKYGGSGLGLAICRKLVGLMDGTIGFENRSTGGTTFSFELALPRALLNGPTGGLTTTSKKSPPITAKPESQPPLCILLVEDNPTNQKVVQSILKRLDQKADLANNGLEAIRAVKNKRYDLILMDVHMPEMDGFNATRQIRQKEFDGHRPKIVALTADVLKGEREKCLDCGMDDYATKPVKIEVLRKIIESIPNS